MKEKQPKNIRFMWYDAWILHSIMLASRKCTRVTLADIVATADYLNHAIPTHCELDQGTRRLAEAGYILIEENKYALSKLMLFRYIEIWQYGSYLETTKIIENYLKAEPWTATYKPANDCSGETVSRVDYEEALKIYVKSI